MTPAGLRCDSGVLLVALPGRPRRRQGRAHRPQDRRGGRRPQVARRRRARLRLVALVGAQELGLHPGWQHGRAGHGPDPGLHQGAPGLGQMGRRQPPPNHHQSLLPGILSQSPQRPRMGGAAGEDVLGGDAAGERRRGVLPRPAQPAGRDREEGLGGHVEAGAAAGHHLHVAAEEGRAHRQVQRRQRQPRHGLHPLVRRRRPGHLEHPLLLLGSHCREFITVLS
ncbi:hypothetical protein GQ55_5G391400 [Panicum hallii var. hallii]|uniref:Uncharacterized protein n=1 Tax=Panicum hallii var. hallii TaxID=1504633 RepID=A0A2T7DN43_9POAL|nr:hypothetical protein GQ55_5G391400 [Panicum hallii var. hallii]